MKRAPKKLIFRRYQPELQQQEHPKDRKTATARSEERQLEDVAEIFSDESIVELELLPGSEGSRHRPLPDKLATDDDNPLFGPSLNWTYRGYIVRSTTAPSAGLGHAGPLGNTPVQPMRRNGRVRQRGGEERTRELCLFNVVVACEWTPAPDYLRQLYWAFRRASDFLYDVTDGRMAFGQVVFGGPELLGCADIQILASSRLHPRAWVDGLHRPEKYTPIRLGRGVWPSRNGVVIPWDEPEGYRTIIHEWGHYALGLRDQYFERRPVVSARTAGLSQVSSEVLVSARNGELPSHVVMLGRQATSSESIMATLEGTSELVPRTSGNASARKRKEWEEIKARFQWIDIPERTLEGPGRLPLPLPQFRRVGSLAGDRSEETERPIELRLAHLPDEMLAERFSAYVLRPQEGENGAYQHMIAQGGPDARFADDGLELLGARAGDEIVLVGVLPDQQPAVFHGILAAPEQQKKEQRRSVKERVGATSELPLVEEWIDATPIPPPAIDVEPDKQVPEPGKNPDVMARVRVRVRFHGRLPEQGQVTLFATGMREPQRWQISQGEALEDGRTWLSPVCPVPSLDGQVLVSWGRHRMVVSYSHGGNPPSSTPASAPPITAGSSDGSVMLFFDEDASERHKDYSTIKVVTAVETGVQGRLPHPAARPWGPAVSLAANAALPGHLSPTLLLRCELPSEREQLTGDLLICRLDGEAWAPQPTYLRPGSQVAAMPVTADTAPSLVDAGADPRIERFQLFWVPRS